MTAITAVTKGMVLVTGFGSSVGMEPRSGSMLPGLGWLGLMSWPERGILEGLIGLDGGDDEYAVRF